MEPESTRRFQTLNRLNRFRDSTGIPEVAMPEP
jgi:hypothetical protein